MIYVQIADGVVVNRALFDGEPPQDWPDRAQWVQSDEAQIGFLYRNGHFTAQMVSSEVSLRRLVPCAMIVDRLQAAGKLAAARAALDAADLYLQERWNARNAIYADDATTISFLRAIGADPDAILAPG